MERGRGRAPERVGDATRRQGLVRCRRRADDAHASTMPRAMEESRQTDLEERCVLCLGISTDCARFCGLYVQIRDA